MWDDPPGVSVRETAWGDFRWRRTFGGGGLPSPGVPVVLAWKPGPEQKEKNPPPPPLCPVFSLQFKNPLILLLLASTLVSVLTKEYEDAVSIAVVSVWGSASSQTRRPRALQSLCLFYYAKKKSVAVEEKK